MKKTTKEKIFTEDEALACFFVAADIVRQEDKSLIPPSVFIMMLGNKDFLIYEDLMMHSMCLLGMKSDMNWDKIYADAIDSDKLGAAIDFVSKFSEMKKKYASAYFCTIAVLDADKEHYYDRYNKYHLYCRKCCIESLMFNGSMRDLLCYKMQKMNGYNFMPEPEDITLEANGVEFNMIRVEGGTFEMGTDEPETFEDGAATDDAPSHKVTVDTFYIGETMVTGELWNKVMDTSSEDNNDLCPMRASWYDCQEFVKRLSKLLGLNFRLPTEAEWEFAARGGKESIGYIYSGSDDIDEVAWYDGNSDKTLHEVKELEPNELGIYDMSGNLLEWCQDWFDDDYYSHSPELNPLGPDNGKTKVIRGGVCNVPDYYSRVELRGDLDPTHNNLTGLRLVMDLNVTPDYN